METILPFIIAAFVFGYQIYANFKKEQEKARKRNPSQGSKQGRPDSKPLKREVLQKRPLQKSEPVYQLPKRPALHEEYAGVQEVDELRRAKEMRKQRPNAVNRLEPQTSAPDHRESHPYADFDLRDAVIKSAILNRPSY
ncbi:hypothetical protein [Olivibacter sp. XZL3]|uniref:hypothetical protein n=1 Tax=Olivibacter sp. XZL3 TaxID=1735116 RepID=UPI0010657FE7|nr:hypothetical protein [Olivibacter sp. XZL3]